jgi:hypothetical protein
MGNWKWEMGNGKWENGKWEHFYASVIQPFDITNNNLRKE